MPMGTKGVLTDIHVELPIKMFKKATPNYRTLNSSCIDAGDGE